MVLGLNPSEHKRSSSSPQYPYWLRDSPSPTFNGHKGAFPRLKQPEHKLTTHFHLVPMLRISGAIYSPCMPSGCGHGKLYLSHHLLKWGNFLHDEFISRKI